MGMMRLKIQDAEGHWITANVFVDEGSDSILMRQGFASLLKVRGAHHILTVISPGGTQTPFQACDRPVSQAVFTM
jgi:hypothetical protein